MKFIVIFLCGVLLSGCSAVKVRYDGTETTPESHAAVLETMPDMAGYTLLGKATAVADQGVERGKMLEALRKKAASVGATDVVITDYRVVPESAGRVMDENSYMVWPDNSAESGNWMPMLRDFNGGYGAASIPIFGDDGGGSKPSSGYVPSYQRVMYAEFLRKN